MRTILNRNSYIIFINSLRCIMTMLKKIKNLSIGAKILITVLSISVISQLIIGIISYTTILDIGNYSKKTARNLGEYASEDSESALKDQAEEYIKKLSKSISDNSDNMLKKINEQVSGMVTSLEDIYVNSGNFKGTVPPLPDMTIKGDTSDRKSGSEKAYVIDKNNLSEDKLHVLSYDPGIYPDKFENNIYKTNINEWLAMNQEERELIAKTKSIVSKNLLPSSLKRELEVISNIFYTIRQMFITNSLISSIYIGTENGMYYEYSTENSGVRYVAAERNWYKDAVQARKKGNSNAVWQGTYVDKATNKLCITCSKAFCDFSGNIIGVAAIDMFLEDINDYLTNFKVGDTGYSFIVDTDGKVIVHPKYSLKEEIGNINSGFISGSEEGENNQEAINHILSGISGIEKIKIDGKQYYLSYYDTQT
ncbi:MAG: cache domain-containing protein, partial [Oscillospiraceae bacterium]|nr:cache domain-containing protein [Oscillospiraceae bacterium]